ncbi:MAG TPA: Rieske (2Fe-2S) protein [Streptosporangiaceae bacterium]
MKALPPFGSVARIEDATWLDPAASRVRRAVNMLIRPQWLRDVLHGVPIGHPLHPLAVQVPIGAWVSATVLDLVPGQERAARILVGTGVLSVLPAVLSGYTDWSRSHEQQLRVGLVHSTANVVATSCYIASWADRSAGRQSRAKAFGLAGLGAVLAGGVLGGHLAYRQASGANHVEGVPHRVPPGWHVIAGLGELVEGRLEQRMLGEVPLLIFRRGDRVEVLAGVCSHLSAPLHDGTVLGDDDPCVVCPWHQSVFSLRTGEVVHGPATSPQPKFQTRVLDGTVEVCLPGAG